jgi:hypothetical protein
MKPPRTDSGQSSVELIALLPLVFVVGLAIMSLLAARSAAGEAAAAAQAGAMALIQDANARSAARAALPEDSRRRARIAVHGRRVTVTVRPSRPPLLASALTTTASAHAGPETTP